MTNTTHTPGPWTAHTTGWKQHPFTIHCAKRPGAIAQIPSRTSVPLEEQSSNARLVAAAPDLLATLEIAEAALRQLAKDSGRHPYAKHCFDIADNARAVIAKAKGE